MLIKDILRSDQPVFSFEFFPPKTPEGWEDLYRTISELVPLNPAYVSVTYGAGGTTRERTHQLVERITHDTRLTVAAHLTCVGSTREEIGQILDQYDKSHVHNILALRGDPPQGATEWQATEGGFTYAADLVAFIKARHPHFGIGVAGFPEGHPATPNRLKEMEYLKAKVDAGADYICTQLFFDNRDFFDFRDRCRHCGIKVPIIAGIMPVSSRKGMQRMADLAAGSRFPAALLRAVDNAPDDDISAIGIHWATEQVRDLVDEGVDGIHFYTLNKADATRRIYQTLHLKTTGSQP